MRNSNIELFRILLFLMIIVIHSTSVGLVVSNGFKMGSLNWFYADFMRSFAGGAVIVFVLITGYFRSATEKSPFKEFLNLFVPLAFYCVIIAAFSMMDTKGSLGKQVVDLLTCQGMFYHLWFMWPYLFLIILSNYLNILIDSINEKQLVALLVILFFSQSVIPTVNIIAGKNVIFPGLFESKMLLFITLYMQGAYLRKYGLSFSVKQSLSGYVFLSIIIGWLNYLYNIGENGAQKLSGPYYPFFSDYTSLLVIVSSILLFNGFIKWKFSSAVVNQIAKYTYGAYLVHVIFITLMRQVLPESSVPYMNYNSSWFPLIDLQYVVIVATASIIIESIRQLFWNKLTNIRV